MIIRLCKWALKGPSVNFCISLQAPAPSIAHNPFFYHLSQSRSPARKLRRQSTKRNLQAPKISSTGSHPESQEGGHLRLHLLTWRSSGSNLSSVQSFSLDLSVRARPWRSSKVLGGFLLLKVILPFSFCLEQCHCFVTKVSFRLDPQQNFLSCQSTMKYNSATGSRCVVSVFGRTSYDTSYFISYNICLSVGGFICMWNLTNQ